MIDPALNAAILVGINTLQTATFVTAPMTKDALIGALQSCNATCAAARWRDIDVELRHIIRTQPITVGLFTRRGFLQADVHALS